MTDLERTAMATAVSAMDEGTQAAIFCHMDNQGQVHWSFSGDLPRFAIMGKALDLWMMEQLKGAMTK